MSECVGVSVGERYRLEQLLGRGGMGAVYRARDRLTDRRVALKLVPVDPDGERPAGSGAPLGSAETAALSLVGLADGSKRASGLVPWQSALVQTMTGALQAMQLGNPSRVHVAAAAPNSSANPIWARMALAQEFRTLASLRHPHIISVLDYGFVARVQPFFAMELLENARTLSAASKGLPLAQKALLLIQLLRALSYLHRHGILHRDLKPTNVMVLEANEGPQVKLLDFGLALARSHIQVKPGEISGTLSYMAPELYEGKGASEAADLFAVGVVAYELFAGRHPFDQGDDVELVHSILRSDPDWEPLKQNAALIPLLQRLLAKSPAARPTADEALIELSAAAGVPVPQESTALRESTLQAARFVGREEPLARLRAAMEGARAGAGSVQLLAGESGVGKSRLMEELRVYALVQGVISARGHAVSEGGGAYGVWREILRTLCLYTKLDELAAGVLKLVVADLESLLEQPIPDAPALNPQAAQLRLVNVMESLILRQTEPLLLLLEDLQWADAESLALLRRLAQSCQARPILIVASFRDDERPELPQALPDCAVLKLARLSASTITELCQSMLGEQGCTSELVTFLEAETEGNIFFVIEVMRALAEDAGQLSLVASRRWPKSVLTGGIQAIVQRRLGRLPAEARPLLRLAAVAGRRLDLAVLRYVEPRLEPWLYLAADAAVLEVSDQAWRFAHDKIRESLLQDLAVEEKQRLHLELASALEATYPGAASHAAALAEHYQRGGNRVKAAFYLVEAGVHALNQGATDQAAMLLQQALAPEGRALLSKVQTARAYNGMVQATIALGRIVPCMALYEQFVAEAGFPMPAGIPSIAAMGGAMLARWLHLAPSISPLTEEDRRIFRDIAQAARWACEAYLWHAQPLKSVVAALQGSEIASALGDKALQSYFLAIFSLIAGLIPLRAASQQLLERANRLVHGFAHSRAELDFRRIASVRHLNAANWELAKPQLDALLALARKLGDEHSLIFGLGTYTLASIRQADEAAFEVYGTELYDRARKNQSDQFARAYPLSRGVNALRQGDAEDAQRWLREAEPYIQKSQDILGQAIFGGLTARCLLAQGKKTEALLRAQATLALFESNRLSVESASEGLSSVIEVYLSLWEAGSTATRQQLEGPLRRALAAMRRCAQRFPAFAPRALLWHSRDAWNHGAFRLARQLAQASQQRAKRLKMPFDEALAAKWLDRFAELPQDGGLFGEPRGLLQFLARRLF